MANENRTALAPPTGTVTFLFSDIQGSTRLLHEIGDAYVDVLAEHRRILRAAFDAHQGVEIGTEGDSFFVAFARASDAVAAAAEAQRGLEGGPVRVRMGLHTGEPIRTAEGYVGMVVHRAARIAAVGHGGQVLLSEAVANLVADRLPADIGLRDLGCVRLKDLAKPEHIYQVLQPNLQESFPALRSLDAIPNNLPRQVTSFIGREQAMAELEALLAKSRLLTLTGSGGAGKTRLSLQVAAACLDQVPDGAWLVELAALTDPALVPQTAATALGVREEAGKAITQTLVEHLKTRKILLLLDNCEHLLAACSTLADTLLRQCAEVRILATSRQALGIQGEQTYRVPSLSLPGRKELATPATLSTCESVRLFIDRAVAACSSFAVTDQNAPALASVCRHLDGIPLAIELAAARVRTLAVKEIDNKLAARFRLLTGGSKTALPRQQTLRALIDWSYDLLGDAEKLTLQRLSVFAGGWTLEAAEAVCGEDGDALDLLTSLADKSLVIAEQTGEATRYQLLETVRDYAREKLVESCREESARQRHWDYYLALVQEAESKLRGAEQTQWLRRLEEEHDNLRASLDWSLVESGSGAGLRLCGALQRFWFTKGHLSEGRQWCARLLAKPESERTPERAKVLNMAGTMANFLGEYSDARGLLTQSLAIKKELGDRRGIAASLSNLGVVELNEGNLASARTLDEQSLEIMRELGDRSGIASSLTNLGAVAKEQGDLAVSRAAYAESLAIQQELGDRWGIALALTNLGSAAFEQGDFASAQSLFEKSLAITRELGDRQNIGATLGNMGVLAHAQRDFASARALHDEHLAIARDLGDRQGIADSLHNLGTLACEQRDYSAAAPLLQEGLAIRGSIGDRRGITASIEELAAVVAALGDPLRAAGILGAAERLREEIGSPLPPSIEPVYRQRVAAARAASPDGAAFERAWLEGRALTQEQAIVFALKKIGEQG